jgi:F0F1-type ATP synthase membrane subunit b/b'
MKYIAVIALLAVMPVLADWRWEGREQARQAVAEARRARAQAMREVAQARREIRREMDSAHREWCIEFRQVREEMRRSWR